VASHDDQPAELRIRGPGWHFYGGTFVLWLLGVALAAFYWGAEALVLMEGPDYTVGGINHRVGFVNQFWAIIFGGAGTLVALGMPLLVAVDTIQSWRHWRMLRRPDAVIDVDGIRFEAPRRSLRISWREVERLELYRKVYKYRTRRNLFSAKTGTGTRTVSMLRARVLPDSPALNTGFHQIPVSRWLQIGRLEKHVDIPYEDAVQFLQRAAGPLFGIKERSERMRSDSAM
jgi:hypothetical protein